jgi:hypothetical protein
VAAGVTEVGASILEENHSVERREPLPRICIELRWRLSGINRRASVNFGGDKSTLRLRLIVLQLAGLAGVGE